MVIGLLKLRGFFSTTALPIAPSQWLPMQELMDMILLIFHWGCLRIEQPEVVIWCIVKDSLFPLTGLNLNCEGLPSDLTCILELRKGYQLCCAARNWCCSCAYIVRCWSHSLSNILSGITINLTQLRVTGTSLVTLNVDNQVLAWTQITFLFTFKDNTM